MSSFDYIITKSNNKVELQNTLIELNERLKEIEEAKSYESSQRDYFNYNYLFLQRNLAKKRLNKLQNRIK